MAAADAREPLLEVRDLVKHYPLTRGVLFKKQIGAVKAVDGVSFDLYKGETLGIVGESGCGKSTVARMLVNLERPTSGQIRYQGEDVTRLSGRALKAVRRDIQMVFQDPYTSLNPRMTVGDIVGEPYEIHPEVAPKRRPPPQGAGAAGGRRPQPRARQPLPAPVLRRPAPAHRHRPRLALRPRIIVADEPVSALDVSVQAQVVNLLESLQAEFGLSYVFIAHDLSIVRHISDRVGVMYLGRIVETGTDAEIYDHPTHPYTQALLSAVPCARPGGARAPRADPPRGRRPLPGEPAVRLPLPHPLLEGARAVRPGTAAARRAAVVPGRRHRRPAPLRLPLRRGEARGAGGPLTGGRPGPVPSAAF